MDDTVLGENPATLEQRRLTSLINSMADGVIALNRDNTVAVYNGAALNILDLNSSIENMKIDGLINLLDKNAKPVDVIKLINETTTATSSRDYLLQYSDGSKINLYVSIAPVHLSFNEDAEGSGHVLLLRDITREKTLEEERDDFISVVSHELRNPIAIVEGNISNAIFVANKSPDIEAIKKSLNEAYEQTAFLAGLIEDLATLSRAERGVLNLEIEDINARDFVQELYDNYKDDAQNKGLQLHVNVDPSLELFSSSRLHVREILQNFITNAIKYTPEGSVTVSAKPAENGVTFSVSDTGMGISTSDKARIFDKFFRAENARTTKINGTGLGLYVTTKLAGMLGAKLSMETELNKGSVFSIYVPNIPKRPVAAQA